MVLGQVPAKIKGKSKSSKPTTTVARIAIYPIIIGLKMAKPTIKGRGRFISLKISFKLCNILRILLHQSWQPSVASMSTFGEVIILSTTTSLPHIKGSHF